MSASRPVDRKPNGVTRIVGSILDPMINAVDLDELLAGVDLDRVLARIDPNTILERVDLGRVITRVDLDEVLRRVDVDAIVRRVDVDAIVERVDVEKIVERVDVEAIVERVDVASIVARVDVDQIVDRVDVARIVERVNVARVATSTATTMTSSALDLVRRQVARLDVLLASFVRRVFRRRAPTALVPGETIRYPAGAFTRLLAYVVDTLAISALLAGAVSLFTYLADLFLTKDLHPTRGAGEWWGVVAAAVTFGYFWLSVAATGRTPGKALLGLRVVRRNGDAVGGRAAFVRALVFPFSFVLGLGFVGVVGGRSRRALHDVAAGTVVVYDRDAIVPVSPMSSAKLRE
jgi:uncharacterized RDD family membrane protein YckC